MNLDAPLVERLSRGDFDALGPLYQRYGADVRSVILRVEPQMVREDADDLCQEVFLTFVDTLGRYTEQGQLRSWLFGIAVRKARSWRRRRWGRRLLGLQHGAAAAGVSLHAVRPTEQIDARHRIQNILESLPAAQREVLVLHVIEGLSARETSDVLGISENAVATRLRRARKTMKEAA